VTIDWSRLECLLRAGDAAAWPLLTNSLVPRLDAYARQYAKDLSPADREIAVDNATEKIVDRIDQYDRTKGSLLTWARAIVRREIDEIRRSSPNALPTDPVKVNDALADVTTGPDPTADAALNDPKELPRAHLAIASIVLQDPDGALIQARLVERLSYDDIAENLGPPPVTAATLRKRFERALQRVKAATHLEPDLQHLWKEDI
jgi:DNA-directed RNA polymerase specialized sigma24 family protein